MPAIFSEGAMDKLKMPWDVTSKKNVTIHIGEFFASSEPVVVSTFLGSCVAACLFDPENRIGGMNHILLPGKASFKDFNVEARFGINAMELLINAMMKLGANRYRIKGKVFGGAHVTPALSAEGAVGRKNADFILEFLERENIDVVSQDMGGHNSRRIYFHTDSAQVFLRRGHTLASRRIAKLEQEKLKRIRANLEEAGKITWF